MVKKTVWGLMALTALFLSTSAGQARDIFKDFQADVFLLGGGSTLVDAHNFETASGLYHSRFDLGPKFAFGVSVPYGKILSIESAYSYGPNNLVVTNTDIFPHVGVVYPVRDYIGSLSAVVRAPVSLFHITPYAEGGVEYDRFSPTPAAISTALNRGFASVSTALITHNDKFGVNLGGGLDRKLSKRLTFRIDLRDHVTGSPAFGLPPQQTSDSMATFPVSGRANNLEYTAGFVFHLGKL
jgi:opacity protein-like surface antigen